MIGIDVDAGNGRKKSGVKKVPQTYLFGGKPKE
jgi:hypothetical protein